jgi:hypothetical protein
VLNTTDDMYLKLRQTDPSKHPFIRKATEFWELNDRGLPPRNGVAKSVENRQLKPGEWFGLGGARKK